MAKQLRLPGGAGEAIAHYAREAVERGLLRVDARGKIIPEHKDHLAVESKAGKPPASDEERAERHRLAQGEAMLRGCRAAGMKL